MTSSGLVRRRLTRFSAVGVVVLILWLLIQDLHAIGPSSLSDDATQNVQSSVNLAKHGVYSMQLVSPDVVPGYRREPLPNLLLALYLRIADAFSPGLLDQVGQVFSDSFLLLIKKINLLWAGGLFLGLWFTSRAVFQPLLAVHWIAAAQLLAVNRFLVEKRIDGMGTELIASAVMVWLGVVLLQANRSRSWRWMLIAGSVFGLMALTKSSGAYVALVVLPLLAFVLSRGGKRFLTMFLAISLGFVVTVAPWIARNQFHFSRPVIAQGGGDVLLIRSVFNEMKPQQFLDSFYAFAPMDVRRDVLGPMMGLSDEDFSCDGRLAVFNRDLECDQRALDQQRFDQVRSFYQRGKVAIPRQLSLERDQKRAYALDRIKERPLAMLTTSLPFAWRGFWGFEGEWAALCWNVAAFPSLFLAPLLALIERRPQWLMVSVVPLAYFMFYGLASHFLNRYSAPLVPSALICLSMLVVDLVERASNLLWPGIQSPVQLSERPGHVLS